jgi:hypothetical protein
MYRIETEDIYQGSAITGPYKKLWEELVKLNGGTFKDSSDHLEFRSMDGKLLKVKKEKKLGEDEQVVSYEGEMAGTRGKVKVDLFKNSDYYLVSSFLRGGFHLALRVVRESGQSE